MGAAVVTKKTEKQPRRVGRGQPGRKLRAEAAAETAERRSALPMKADPLDVLQESLDGRVADLRYVQSKVDALTENDEWRDTMMLGKIPNEWIRLRDEYRDGCERIALALVKTGIADRQVRVAEAQMALLAQNVRAAAERAGLSPTQVRALGSALRQIAQEGQSHE